MEEERKQDIMEDLSHPLGRDRAPTSIEDQSAVFYEIVYLPDNQICVDCGKINGFS